MNDLRTRVHTFEESSVDKTVVTRLENKIRDLEAKLDLETTTRHRLEVSLRTSDEPGISCLYREKLMHCPCCVKFQLTIFPPLFPLNRLAFHADNLHKMSKPYFLGKRKNKKCHEAYLQTLHREC